MSLKKNIFSLGLVQIFTYIVPLIQLPYLSRVLGIEQFGIFSFTLSTIQFLNIVTDFGFNMYFPQVIAGGDKSRRQLSKIYSIALISKGILSLISVSLFSIVIYSSGYLFQHPLFFSIYALAIIGNAFLPIWHYQGLEKLHSLTAGIVTTKILALLLLFIFIKDEADFDYVAIINALQIVSIAVYFNIKISSSGVRFVTVKLVDIRESFRESYGFFLSRAAVSLYTVGCGVYLGIFSTPTQVAIYNVAEQLYRAGTQVFAPITQAAYPYMVRTKNFSVYYKIIIASISISILGALFGYFAGEQLITLIFGIKYLESANILHVFMVTIIFSTGAVMFGYPLLVPLGKAKQANVSVLYAGLVQLISLFLIYLSGPDNSAIKVAYSVLVCELVVLLLRLYAFLRTK